MRSNSKRGLTLIELIISVIIFGIIVVGFFALDIFTREQLIATERRQKVQNDAYFVLGHISKQLARAIGDVQFPAVTITPLGLNTQGLVITVDANGDGIRDMASDFSVAYCFKCNCCNGPAGTYTYTLSFSPHYSAPVAVGEVLSEHVFFFNAAALAPNLLQLNITTCWNPADAATCGTPGNPSVNLTDKVKMPMVSLQ